MGYRKILVPLDGSELAEAILKQVETIAAPKAHVHLLRVVGLERIDELAATASAAGQPFSPVADPRMTNPNFDDPESIKQYEAYLKLVGEPLTLDGYWVTVAVRKGSIADTIIEEANNGQFDVIAMATHGRTGIGRLMLGSVTQAVLAKAQYPVLVLPPPKPASEPAVQAKHVPTTHTA
jgi:nucleotide-binding universal stress UspA family protein